MYLAVYIIDSLRLLIHRWQNELITPIVDSYQITSMIRPESDCSTSARDTFVILQTILTPKWQVLLYIG